MDAIYTVPPLALWLGFIVVVGIFAIISAVLVYHWRNYTFDKEVSKRVMRTYFYVSGIFVLLLTASLLSLTL